ncbi:MAG: 6-phosphofructokinase [Epulopiscium sp. Nele67-Bin001]|nr:MAG: 6-phosphofructokinase [Epulopiscium sp. Nele67-Bin001]
MKQENCIVGQSGGPTVAINASLAGIIASRSFKNVYGMLYGIEGLLNGNITNLSALNNDKFINELTHTPAMYLGSCRYKLPNSQQVYDKVFNIFKKHNITTMFYIGGNDSMDTVLKLSKVAPPDIKILGIPKTIDNDLPLTDYTPGYGSAAKYIATTFLEIAHDAYTYNLASITIVEVMGRNAGWLTAAASLARTNYCAAPHLIYLPEIPFCLNKFVEDVIEIQKQHRIIVIAVSEGIKDIQGEYISAETETVDAFGHHQLCGVAKVLESRLRDEVDCKIRSIEINVLQRSSAHCASSVDIQGAFSLGTAAVAAALDGETGKMMCFNRLSNSPYKYEIVSKDIFSIANLEKPFPAEWIFNSDVSQAYIEYALPLIQGEAKSRYENGIPVYCDIAHLMQK